MVLHRVVLKGVPPSGASPLPAGASDRVVVGILKALELQQLAPGQRLIETDLAARFAVGRNAVREAIQQLAGRGIVDLTRNRSPAIRTLSPEEALEVLEVAEVMTSLLARAAARNFDRPKHLTAITAVNDELAACEKRYAVDVFNRARRRFYRVLLDIAGNRELRRLFLTIHMEIIHAQYQSPRLQDIRLADYRIICVAVMAGDVKGAAAAAARHVRRVSALVRNSQ
jgi:DNA-binding GntR family transcriptional regulator